MHYILTFRFQLIKFSSHNHIGPGDILLLYQSISLISSHTFTNSARASNLATSIKSRTAVTPFS